MTSELAVPSAQRDDAFRQYVLPELDVLLRVAMRLTRHPANAEDLVQETVLRAYRALDRFDGRHPRAWLLTIMRNTNINRARKRTPDLLHDQDRTFAELRANGADGRSGPEETVLENTPHEQLIAGLRGLSDRYRDTVILVDVEGLSYQEAADVLGVPIGTIMSRLHRARTKLRHHLETHGVTYGRSAT